MATENSQVPWTDEQWARVRQAIQEEANRARVAATFLPLYGPLPADTDYVSTDVVTYGPPPGGGAPRLGIEDTVTLQIPTLQVKVYLRGAQMADPDLVSVLTLFRRAANVLARLEDAVVFRGQAGASQGPAGGVHDLPKVWEILGGQRSDGLWAAPRSAAVPIDGVTLGARGEAAVGSVSDAIGNLEAKGHFGPFAVVLGQNLFSAVQTPNRESLVLPQDRIIPFLGGGGTLLRSSTLPADGGVVIALGAAPVELVVATDVSLNFLQVTTDPRFVFRVFEKILLRVKEPEAIVRLGSDEATTKSTAGSNPSGDAIVKFARASMSLPGEASAGRKKRPR